MLKLFILLALTIVFFIQTAPAYCGVSKTVVFHITVTLPAHVMADNDLSLNPFSNKPYQNQIVQTQTVIRDSRTISLISVVVP
jgi:hypothetical protein